MNFLKLMGGLSMKKRSGEKIKLLSVDELLGVPSGDPVTEIDVQVACELRQYRAALTA